MIAGRCIIALKLFNFFAILGAGKPIECIFLISATPVYVSSSIRDTLRQISIELCDYIVGVVNDIILYLPVERFFLYFKTYINTTLIPRSIFDLVANSILLNFLDLT